MNVYRWLVIVATGLTFVVVVVGAYVRLSDAGLGCPDWPGCYGQLTPEHAERSIAQAVSVQGGTHGPVSMPKAWKEMGHRYLAGGLGLLILSIAIVAWLRSAALRQPVWLPFAIVLVVGIQATLGKWTVTMLLKPAIVTGHLVGGMTTFGLLVWLSLRQCAMTEAGNRESVRALGALSRAGLAALCVQIVLGGWVSTNYAALACPDLPLCRGALVPPMDFGNAFHVVRELGMTPSGDLLSIEALTAIHWVHRMFALPVTAVLATLAWRLLGHAGLRSLGWLLVAALGLQLSLGIANVVLGLPLVAAAAHNAGAALLLGLMIVINYVTFHGLAPDSVMRENAHRSASHCPPS